MKISASILLVLLGFSGRGIAADSRPALSATADNEEVAGLFAADQADRQPKADGKPIDWEVVGPRDDLRLKRVKEVYAAGGLKTGKDYFHAGVILQHSDKPEDYLLCHELCVTAVFKSERNEKIGWLQLARWLAAASQDRFLLSIGRPQRFGTQFSDDGLARIEDGVTDEIRKAWHVPTLAEARARAAEMKNRPNKSPEPTPTAVTPRATEGKSK